MFLCLVGMSAFVCCGLCVGGRYKKQCCLMSLFALLTNLCACVNCQCILHIHRCEFPFDSIWLYARFVEHPSMYVCAVLCVTIDRPPRVITTTLLSKYKKRRKKNVRETFFRHFVVLMMLPCCLLTTESINSNLLYLSFLQTTMEASERNNIVCWLSCGLVQLLAFIVPHV